MEEGLREREPEESPLRLLAERLMDMTFPSVTNYSEKALCEDVIFECLLNAYTNSLEPSINKFTHYMGNLLIRNTLKLSIYTINFASEPIAGFRYKGLYELPLGDEVSSRERIFKKIVKYVGENCDYETIKDFCETFSRMALAYPNDFRTIANDLNRLYKKELKGKKGCEYKKCFNDRNMGENRTYIIKGDYIENNGQIYNAPVQYNTYNGNNNCQDSAPHAGKGVHEGSLFKGKTPDKLADMISQQFIDRYKRKFNELLAPYLVSSIKDPMDVVDMKFETGFKKKNIYEGFSVLSNYLKSEYIKEDLALYMQRHIEGMPRNVDSILRYLR